LVKHQQQSTTRGAALSLFGERYPTVQQELRQLVQVHRTQIRMEHERHDDLMQRQGAIETQLKHMKELLMALSPEVQALVDQDAQLKASVDAMKDRLGAVSAQVADLQSKLASVPPAGASAEDIAAIKSVTADIAASVAEAHDAVAPAPVEVAPAPVEVAPEAQAVVEAPAVEAPAAE
jgi:chromosome segregation ATPase